MRRLSSRPPFASAGLSRIKFLGGATAFLVGCSGARTIPPTHNGSLTPESVLPSSLHLSPESLPAKTKRRNGIIVSTSANGHAIAAHDRHGNFLASVAMGQSFVRGRAANGSTFVFPVYLASARESAGDRPIFLSTGHVLRFRTERNGRVLARLQSGAGSPAVRIPKMTFALEANGSVTYFKGRGKNRKPYATTIPRNHRITNQAQYNAALARSVDRPGAWTADDDFNGSPGDYAPNVGLTGTRPPTKAGKRRTSAARRVESTNGSGENCSTMTSTWNTSTWTTASSTFNSGSFGSSGYYGGGGGGGVVPASHTRTTSGLSGVCIRDGIVLAMSVAAYLDAMDAPLPACILLAELGFIPCILSIAFLALTGYVGFVSAQQWQADKCPMPPGVIIG